MGDIIDDIPAVKGARAMQNAMILKATEILERYDVKDKTT